MSVNKMIADMNTAFGNPKGDFNNIDYARLRSQCQNIFDEYCELQDALCGRKPGTAKQFINAFGHDAMVKDFEIGGYEPNVDQIRDSLCDIQVFASGAQHLMGVNADHDMEEVVSKVMTRFIKDDDDKLATQVKHAAAGVTKVYFEGQYPTMVMKSAEDQPDAPKGKFLKSASYEQPVFSNPVVVDWMTNLDSVPDFLQREAYVIAQSVQSCQLDTNAETGQPILRLKFSDGSKADLSPEPGHFAYKAN